MAPDFLPSLLRGVLAISQTQIPWHLSQTWTLDSTPFRFHSGPSVEARMLPCPFGQLAGFSTTVPELTENILRSSNSSRSGALTHSSSFDGQALYAPEDAFRNSASNSHDRMPVPRTYTL